jgi:hypothetical protein
MKSWAFIKLALISIINRFVSAVRPFAMLIARAVCRHLESQRFDKGSIAKNKNGSAILLVIGVCLSLSLSLSLRRNQHQVDHRSVYYEM